MYLNFSSLFDFSKLYCWQCDFIYLFFRSPKMTIHRRIKKKTQQTEKIHFKHISYTQFMSIDVILPSTQFRRCYFNQSPESTALNTKPRS